MKTFTAPKSGWFQITVRIGRPQPSSPVSVPINPPAARAIRDALLRLKREEGG